MHLLLLQLPLILVTCTRASAALRPNQCLNQASTSNHRGAPLASQTMRWPWSGKDNDQGKTIFAEPVQPSHATDWQSSFTEPRTLIPSLALTLTTVAVVRLYKTYLRRIPTVNHIKPRYFRRRSLFGQVTSVGDADNFRLYHTPGGKIAGWGWLPWKKVPTKRDELTKQTVSIAQ